MASPGVSRFRRRQAALGLAGALLLTGLLATLLITGGVPSARAAGPVLTVSSSTTNPGGTVFVTGTGWAPAKHYNLYVYGQARCKTTPPCPPPSGVKPITSSPLKITSDGSLGQFQFTFIKNAAATTYVFTVVADYPADHPYSASVLVQVVPKGTPPSGTPVSSVPTAPPATTPTKAASPTTTSQAGGTPGNQTDNTTGASGSNTLAIIIVSILLVISIAVLIGLLIVLPPKRRAIRAAWYGAGSASGPGGTGARRYGVSGPIAPPGARRTTGGYPPLRDEEPLPWQGGVAQWDDPPPPPRGSRPLPPRPPRRPPGSEY